MDALTAVALGFLAALGILYLVGALFELLFRRELRRGVLVLNGDAAFSELLRSLRATGCGGLWPGAVVVCTRCGGADGDCARCVRGRTDV